MKHHKTAALALPVGCTMLLITALSAVFPSTAAAGPVERYALLVGVHEYSQAKQLHPLEYSENDVDELAQVLIENGYSKEHVVIMTQKAGGDNRRYLPLKVQIQQELRRLIEACSATDTLVVALSGHGISLDDKSYFCPADARLNDKESLVSLTDLFDEIGKAKAAVRVLLVDACRNDPLADKSKSADEMESTSRPKLPPLPGGVMALFSCSEKEKSFEDDKLKHGVFFNFVIDKLRQAPDGDNGEVTVLGLGDFVTRQVQRFVQNKHRVKQTPEVLGQSRGTVTLVSPDTGTLAYRHGLASLEKDEFDKAIEAFTRAISCKPKLSDAFRGRATARNRKGDYAQARDDASEAIRLDPKNAKAYRSRGYAHIYTSELDKAIADYSEAIKLNPTDDQAYVVRAYAYLLKSDFDKAIADASEAIRLKPDNALAYTRRAMAHAEKREFDQVIADATEAIRLNPQEEEAYSKRAFAYIAREKYAQAIGDSSACIDLNPQNAEAHKFRAFAYAATNEEQKALDDYSQAIRLNPKDPEPYANRGRVYIQLLLYSKAIDDFTAAIKLDPREAKNYEGRATAYEKVGEISKANADRAKARQLQSK
jgi:tetratricopeptide (TPR) repeat protein